jgi:hypothetical protein
VWIARIAHLRIAARRAKSVLSCPVFLVEQRFD